MEVIWVLYNVEGNDEAFYSRLRILMLVASVSLWKKYHPTHKTVFYCDDLTHEILSKLDIFKIFDEVRPLPKIENIDTGVFWSSPKTKVISETKIPLLLVDHDFLIYKNIDEHLTDKVLYTYDEESTDYYPPESDWKLDKLTTPVKRLVEKAANVCLFYLPNPEFARKYAKQTLKNHEELTSLNSDETTPNHMVFSEQFMLKQWLIEQEIPHDTLSQNIWDCHKVAYSDKLNDRGIWNKRESMVSYKHYGLFERRLREGILEGYDKEIEYLYRCIKVGKLLDVDQLKEKMKVITYK